MAFQGATVKPFMVDGGQMIANLGYYSSIGLLHPGERVDLLLRWSGTSTSVLHESVDIVLDDE